MSTGSLLTRGTGGLASPSLGTGGILTRLVGYLWVICQTETEVNPTFDCVLGLSRRFSKTHLKLSKALEDITKDSTGLADVNKSQESVALTTKPFKYLRFR